MNIETLSLKTHFFKAFSSFPINLVESEPKSFLKVDVETATFIKKEDHADMIYYTVKSIKRHFNFVTIRNGYVNVRYIWAFT